MVCNPWLFPLILLCFSAIFFYGYSTFSAFKFWQQAVPFDAEFTPPITILKPLCGLEWKMYENLASFCQQSYPQYQIVFLLENSQDLSIKIVRQLMDEFPQSDIQLIIGDRSIGTNPKINNLAKGLAVAKYPILAIADSDIQVDKNYLKMVVQPLKNSEIGLVTCLYTSVAQGWVAAFEALAITTQFHANILTALHLNKKISFALGATIFIRKSVLEAIGGWQAVADHLADDYQLGYQTTKIGYQVFLCNYVVRHVLGKTTLKEAIKRQIRWIKCIKVEQPRGYIGLILTEGLANSLLLFALSGAAAWSGWLLGVTLGARFIMAWVVGVKVLGDPIAKKYFWLIPLRDLSNFTIWCYCFFNNEVEWRGKKFHLQKGGKLCLTTSEQELSINNIKP